MRALLASVMGSGGLPESVAVASSASASTRRHICGDPLSIWDSKFRLRAILDSKQKLPNPRGVAKSLRSCQILLAGFAITPSNLFASWKPAQSWAYIRTPSNVHSKHAPLTISVWLARGTQLQPKILGKNLVEGLQIRPKSRASDFGLLGDRVSCSCYEIGSAVIRRTSRSSLVGATAA